MAGSSKTAIYAALVGNSLIALTKFAAATISGSAAMFSEGIHSLVDTGNQVLLLYGLKRAEKPPDAEFPFGYGKEVYFWSFVVAILIFGLGAGISIYQGWNHLGDRGPMENPIINYVVLGFAIVFEGGALFVAFREFNRSRGTTGIIQAVRRGKDPTLFVVVFEDSAALLGLLFALVGVGLYQITGDPVYDALASIGIGVILALTAGWLAFESKGLLIGESASPAIVAAIAEITQQDTRVLTTNEVATLHMGPAHIIVTLSLDFVDGIDSSEVEAAVTELNRSIKAIDPAIRRVFVEAERTQDHLSVEPPGRLPPPHA
ncbi:MAG: cation diffusion facilitator family transporter [Pseudomonadales bacterium]